MLRECECVPGEKEGCCLDLAFENAGCGDVCKVWLHCSIHLSLGNTVKGERINVQCHFIRGQDENWLVLFV